MNIIGKLAVVIFLLSPMAANADVIAVTNYDVSNTQTTGCGGWGHTYSGTISISATPGPTGCTNADYSGGSGTMNDGVVGDSTSNTQYIRLASDASITIYFDDYYLVNTITIFGGDIFYNALPGRLTDMIVSFGTTSTGLLSGSPFGHINSQGNPANDIFDLSGTALDGIAVNSLRLSGFASLRNKISINEITVDGGTKSVPEPGTLALLGLGLVSMAARRRKKV